MTKIETDAATILAQIETAATKQAKHKEHKEQIATLKVGQALRQGDIYLLRVPKTHPRGEVRTDRQLAVGSTRGSRHFAVGGEVYEGTTAPKWAARALLGPLLVNPEVVTHPEHAHVRFAGAYTIQVTHQLDAVSMARVQD